MGKRASSMGHAGGRGEGKNCAAISPPTAALRPRAATEAAPPARSDRPSPDVCLRPWPRGPDCGQEGGQPESGIQDGQGRCTWRGDERVETRGAHRPHRWMRLPPGCHRPAMSPNGRSEGRERAAARGGSEYGLPRCLNRERQSFHSARASSRPSRSFRNAWRLPGGLALSR